MEWPIMKGAALRAHELRGPGGARLRARMVDSVSRIVLRGFAEYALDAHTADVGIELR